MKEITCWSDVFESKTPVLILLGIGLIFLVLLRKLIKSRTSNSVLLLGASGSGKTTLFYQLRDGTTHAGTVPSMQYNKDTLTLKLGQDSNFEKTLELIDIPGHPKTREAAAQFYGSAKAILFLVDAVDFMAQKTAVAEYLYTIVSDPTIQKRRVPVLLVCNKTDEGARAHTPDFVRKRLEKELEALRVTRATLDQGGSKERAIAKEGELFSFVGLKSPRVSVASASALKNDLKEVLTFLE